MHFYWNRDIEKIQCLRVQLSLLVVKKTVWILNENIIKLTSMAGR